MKINNTKTKIFTDKIIERIPKYKWHYRLDPLKFYCYFEEDYNEISHKFQYCIIEDGNFIYETLRKN